MQGTQKQIDWATDIKAKRIADLENLEALPIPEGHPAKSALATIRSKYDSDDANNAGWWITHDQTAVAVQGLANDLANNRSVHWPTDTNQGWE